MAPRASTLTVHRQRSPLCALGGRVTDKRDAAIARLRARGILGPDEEPSLETLLSHIDKYIEHWPPNIQKTAENLAYHLKYDSKEKGEI